MFGFIKKVFFAKLQFHGHVINDLNGDEIIGTIYEKNYKRLINKNLG